MLRTSVTPHLKGLCRSICYILKKLKSVKKKALIEFQN